MYLSIDKKDALFIYVSVCCCIKRHQMDQFLIEDLHDVLRPDSLSSSHPIYVPVSNPNEINEIFDKISYSKAS